MDIFARYGGDEFVIIIPDANISQVLVIAERIKNCVAATPFIVNQNEIFLESSIGVAQIRPNEDFSSLLNRADQCMYLAKQKGKNQVETENHFFE